MFIYSLADWPHFHWDIEKLMPLLAGVRNKQGRLLGKMSTLGFDLRQQANMNTLTHEIIQSNRIEGEVLQQNQVRSSVARRLGLDDGAVASTSERLEGLVTMMMDATQHFEQDLTKERLFQWHASIFPTGFSGRIPIRTGQWRNDTAGPMQVVSGALGRERVHFQAPPSQHIDDEMNRFLDWFNRESKTDWVIKAAIAHLWFLTIHPFDDGNGRIARALSDLMLARSDEQSSRFYCMSVQIRKERSAYYRILERTQRGDMNVTAWVEWFLQALAKAIEHSDSILEKVLIRHSFYIKNSETNLNDRQKKMVRALLEDFSGVLTSTKWAKMNKCSPDTALRDIQDLIGKGILEKKEKGGRSTQYDLVLPKRGN